MAFEYKGELDGYYFNELKNYGEEYFKNISPQLIENPYLFFKIEKEIKKIYNYYVGKNMLIPELLKEAISNLFEDCISGWKKELEKDIYAWHSVPDEFKYFLKKHRIIGWIKKIKENSDYIKYLPEELKEEKEFFKFFPKE